MAKILLIEDNPVDIEMIRTILKKRGNQIIVANNGKEGISRAMSEKPDLILMDMILPGMHGLEAAMKLKKFPGTKEIPIIALTALGGIDFINECFDEGISAFIKKPYNPEELIGEIDKIIGSQKRSAKKILIIYNEPLLVTMITMNLMRHGYHVMTVSDGNVDVDQAVKAKPDLILLDDDSFEGGVIAIIEQLKSSDNKVSIPIILITDRVLPKKIEKETTQLGVEDFIIKPLYCNEVIDKVKKVLGN